LDETVRLSSSAQYDELASYAVAECDLLTLVFQPPVVQVDAPTSDEPAGLAF
jgi:hypothetical protein